MKYLALFTPLRRALPIVVVGMGMFALSACDVGVDPKDRASAEVVFSEDGSYEQFLAKLYAGLNVTGQSSPAGDPDIVPATGDVGFSQYMRLYWTAQELSTVSSVISWNDEDLQPINNHTFGPANGFSSDMYNRIFFQVSMANEFLRESTDDLLDERGVQREVVEQMPQWRAEARFLRALSYWHGIDIFGNIPLVTEEFDRGADPPEQATRAELFEFVEQELLEITGEAGDGNEILAPIGEAEYGRADQGAAYMLLSKLYQNAPVYVGENRSSDVVTYTEKIIDSDAYRLEEEYHDLFLADNAFSPEFIFAVPQDGDRTRHFGGTTFLGNAALAGGDEGPAAGSNFGLSGWAGLRTTSTTVSLFEEESAPSDAVELEIAAQEEENTSTQAHRSSLGTASVGDAKAHSPPTQLEADTTMDEDNVVVTLTWDDPGDADAYYVYRSEGQDFAPDKTMIFKEADIPEPGDTTDMFQRPESDSLVYYQVTAIDESDTRAVFPNTPGNQFVSEDGRSKNVTGVGEENFQGNGGFVVPKYQNVTSGGAPGVNQTHSDVDYPVFRLADVYLMYAEAYLRDGGGSEARAVRLVNEIRERAFDGTSGNITSGDLTLEFIRAERNRELLWEGHRRTDDIRFEDFRHVEIGNPEGVQTESFRELYPLPAPELRANPNLDQNPNY